MITHDVSNQWGLQFPCLIVLWLKLQSCGDTKSPGVRMTLTELWGAQVHPLSLWILFPELIPLRENTLVQEMNETWWMAEGKTECLQNPSEVVWGFSSLKNLGEEAGPGAWPPAPPAPAFAEEWLSLKWHQYPHWYSHSSQYSHLTQVLPSPMALVATNCFFPAFLPSISWQNQKEFRAGVLSSTRTDLWNPSASPPPLQDF